MDGNYEKCLEMILHHEGGYVNHPKDPGGMTNLGVTRRVYESWLGHAVDEHTMRGLTPEDVGPLNKKNYWDKVKGDQLPAGLDLCIFDFGVNAGPGRAAKYLQNMIGTVADGGIGPNTLKALAIYEEEVGGVAEVVKEYQKRRQGYYESLSTFETFGRGWTRRTTETTEAALNMI